MLVPVDAWNKVLGQLGNLHEAGQQLAEARERAARAETQVEFFKERIARLEDELGHLSATPTVGGAPDAPPAGEEPTSHRRRRLFGWELRRRR